jgi:putative endonuclease
MARHNETGKQGEALARRYLLDLGWQLLETNWRCGRAEIDFIAMDGDVLVFLEVKTRRTTTYGAPEEGVSDRKMELMVHAAGVYMEQIGHNWEIRFDVISIFWPQGREPEINHLRDAFFPGI